MQCLNYDLYDQKRKSVGSYKSPQIMVQTKAEWKNLASYINFYFRHVSDILKVSTLSVNPPNRGQTIIL